MEGIVRKLSLFLCLSIFLPLACTPVDTIYRRPVMVMSIPKPINDNSGRYLSPYTSKGELTIWAQKFIDNELIISTSYHLGVLAVESAKSENKLVGRLVNDSVGKDIAVSVLSGDNLVRNTSDTSFDNLKDLVIYVYVHYSETEQYHAAVKAMMVVYPELEYVYQDYIQSAALISGY